MSGQAVLYAAKSTEDIHGSIPTQLEDGRRLAEREGLEVVGEYADEAASAYNGDRGPELAAALGHAQRIGASLIVQHSDRLARGDGIQARHLGELYFASYKTGMTLRSVQDDSTFQNPILAVVMGERNMEDSRRTSMAVKAGLERRRERGLYSAGHTPFGYQRVRNEDDERVLVIDEEKAPWVRRLFELYLEGKGYADIARELEAEGVPSPKEGALWAHFTVRKILFNPVYAGFIRSGGKLWEGSHEPIIDRETWDKTVALREAKARTYKRGRPSAGKHLFRKGFLKCGMCGEPMSPLTYRERPHPTDQIYRCLGRKRHSHTCDMSAVYRSDVDSAVYAYFRDLGGDAESTREQLANARELELFMERELLRNAEEGIGAAKGRLERVKRDYLSEQLSATEWQELRAELEPALLAAQAEAERLRRQIKETENESTHSKLSTDLLCLLSEIRTEIAKEVVDSKDAAAIRASLMRLFDGFVLHRGSPGPETGEGTKAAYWLEPVLGQHRMGGYVGRLKTKLRTPGSGFPTGKAKNNFDASKDGCEKVEAPEPRKESLPVPKQTVKKGEKLTAMVETSCGTFDIALDTTRAPKTTNSFAYLARKGFYDELTFHRVVPGFVIQGGDPAGTGAGGPGYSVTEKPPANLTYTKGVVAMAKSAADPPGSSGSQFFVVTSANASLPPEYALLGKISSGMKVVETIDNVPVNGEEPKEPVVIKKVSIEPG